MVEVIAKITTTINKLPKFNKHYKRHYWKVFRNYQKKQNVKLVAENGRYPNSLLFFHHPSNKEVNNLDSLMTSFVDEFRKYI